MFSNDYVMKMIAQFIRALVEIVRKRKEKNYEEALVQIKAASQFYLGTDVESLLKYSPDAIVEYFKDDPEKSIMAAELIYELALICDANEAQAESTHLKTLSLALFIDAIPKDPQFQAQAYLTKANDLIYSLADALSTEVKLDQFKDFTKHNQAK